MEHEIEILLVEDNASDAELTIRALKQNHLANKLVHLKDGAEALDFIFAKGVYSHRKVANSPKIILLDLKMPKVGGLELIRHVHQNFKDVGIITITAYATIQSAVTAVKEGAE